MKRSPLKRKTKLRKIGGRRAWWLKRSISWSKEVRARDKCCQMCQSRDNLEAHHCHPRGSFPSVRFVLANGLTLCRDCHAKWHQASATHRTWWRKKWPERALEVQKSIDERRAMREHESDELSEPVRNRRGA